MKKLICTILCGFLLLGSSTFVAKAMMNQISFLTHPHPIYQNI